MVTTEQATRFVVVCAAYRSHSYRTRADADHARKLIEALGACGEEHRVEEVPR